MSKRAVRELTGRVACIANVLGARILRREQKKKLKLKRGA